MKEDDNINKNERDIKIVVGDESELNISEVNDCMNPLRPKMSTKKPVIIPTNKKKIEKKKEEKREIKLNIRKKKNNE